MNESRSDLENVGRVMMFRPGIWPLRSRQRNFFSTAGGRSAEVIVWDSGEVELSFVDEAGPLDEHHDVDNMHDLERLLARVVEWVRLD